MGATVAAVSGGTSVRRVIVGTAGHIDHGKTTLVERLTGIRTDRLPEEQERGMTIDVGYAELRLPDGTEVGLVDVPGHERLVRTMVAGATSMDIVLLVVAADDGPMLQTREHVDVLDLLGVRRAVVALTKIDVAGPERTADAEGQVRALLAGTTMAGAPIVRVSSVTGQGIEALRAELFERIPVADVRGEDPRAFRMPVLRAFVAPGRGTVVTGIPAAGRLAAGDEVELLPLGRRSRVRGVQVHHRDAPEARAGHRAALLVPDLLVAEVVRGMVVAAVGALAPAERVGARVAVLRARQAGLLHRALLRLHVGASHVPVRLHVLDGAAVAPGAVAGVELQALEPLLAAPGDRFLLRTANDSDTVGGGVIVTRLGERLPRTPASAAMLLERAGRVEVPGDLVLDTLATAGEQGLLPPELAVASGLLPQALPALLDGLRASGRVLRTRQGRWFEAAAFGRLRARLLAAADQLHAADPGLPSVPLTAWRARLQSVPAPLLEDALGELEASGDLQNDGRGRISSARHAAALPPEDRKRCEQVLGVLRQAAGAPPAEEAIAARLALTPAAVRHALALLEARREVLRLGALHFDAAWIEEAKRRLTALGARGAAFTPSQACQALATSRRFGLPLLEALDRQGFTKRAGAGRTLR